MRLAKRFGAANLLRRDLSLMRDELAYAPSVPTIPTIRAAPSAFISGRSTLAKSLSGYCWSRAFSTGWIGCVRPTAVASGIFIPSPDSDISWSVYNEMNGKCAEMSSEAVGICACLRTFSHHACRTGSPAMSEHFYHLREFMLNHPESSAIMNIID